MKRILLTALAAILIIALGTLGYLYFSINTLVKKAVETVGPRITKTDVRLASASLSPFSGSGALSGFVVGNPEGYKGRYALKFGSITVSVDKASLLKETVVINSITVRNPSLVLIGTPFGNNLGKLLKNIQTSSPKSTEKKSPPSNPSKKFIVKRVVISGASVDVVASGLNQKIQQTLPIPDITLRNLGSDGSGVSPSELASQIMVPLINGAVKEGVNTLAKQGVQQLQKQGMEELQKALPGLFKN